MTGLGDSTAEILKRAVVKHEVIVGAERNGAPHAPLHVAFGVDIQFVRAMAITLTSILCNNLEETIFFHVFSDKVSQEDRQKFEKLVIQYPGTAIHIYTVDQNQFARLSASQTYPYAIYHRFLIPGQLRGQTDKVLYLDADIICLGKIRSLFEIDLQDYAAAVVADLDNGLLQDRLTYLKLGHGQYFNSGVICMDIEKWQAQTIASQSIQALIENYERFKLPDQDALNVILDGNVQFAANQWNQIYDLEHMQGAVPSNAIFLHYAGRQKPWHAWTRHHQAVKFFDQYAARSLWNSTEYTQPRHYKEMRMLAKSLLVRKNFFPALFWLLKYSKEKLCRRLK